MHSYMIKTFIQYTSALLISRISQFWTLSSIRSLQQLSSCMSVKLPLIIKRQPILDNHSKHIKADPSPDLEEEIPTPEEENYQQNADFEEIEQSGQVQPLQTITVLKNQSQQLQTFDQINVAPLKKMPQSQDNHKNHKLQELQRIFEEKEMTINELRNSVTERKKQIKTIGDQIDKDLNKSLLKATKQSTVNIRDIFSAPQKGNNQKINELTEEIKKVRLNAKKVKQQIQKMQDSLSDPVSLMNQERGNDCERRIRSAEEDIRTIQHQKTMLSQEITRGNMGVSEEDQKQKTDNYNKLAIQLTDLLNNQKQQKLQLYRIQKEDIFLMEKIKFFQEKEGLLGSKKIKINQKEKQKLQQQIRQLIQQINQTMEERNKVEVQKKQQFKNLTNQISAVQTKNWELCNKLRQIDAFLLQYYEKKAKKKESKNIQKTIQVLEKSASSRIQAQSINSQTLNKSKFSENDKNVSVEVALVEKKKIYQFGLKQPIQNQIVLSDQFLGNKITLKSLTLIADEQQIYSITAQYYNNFQNIIDGLVMGSKILPQNAYTIKLNLQKSQVINFIHAGYCQKQSISFIHFVTSQGKQLKWGKLQHLVKSQQKHIKSYEASIIKIKLVQKKDPADKFLNIIAGFTLITTYMSPK